MDLLVLGGTRFVGRALVADALARGCSVTALHRGVTGALPEGITALHADRTDAAALEAALGDGRWDAVVDTWAGDASVAATAAELLADRVDAYAYVSSVSVYAWGQHVDEASPLADLTEPGYAADKLGAEIAVRQVHPQALLLRAGLVLGPYEDIGRLPWWLGRVAAGGRVVAPGRPERPLQWVDARDLAAFTLDGLASRLTGPYDLTCRSGHATTHGLLLACVAATGSDAELVWVDEEALEAAGAQPWTHLPCWVPETGTWAGFLEADPTRALAAGLACRPVQDTVADTWAWLQEHGSPPPRSDRPAHGLPDDIERALLAAPVPGV